jgi:hypothetical protein
MRHNQSCQLPARENLVDGYSYEEEDRSSKRRRSSRNDESEDRRRSRPRKRKLGSNEVYILYSQASKLPRICARCGAKAVTTCKKRFSVPPSKSEMLGDAIKQVGGVYTFRFAKKEIHLPFCNAHKHYFLWRFMLIVIGAVPSLVLGLAGGVAFWFWKQQAGQAVAGGILLFSLFFFPWLFVCIFANYFWSIRATASDNDGITLTNISPEFADAVNGEMHPSC